MLVAVVILGIAVVVIFEAMVVGYRTLEHAHLRQWALVMGSSKVAEVDIGIERGTKGTLQAPNAATLFEWSLGSSAEADTKFQSLQVRWHGPQDENYLFLHGFVSPNATN